MRRQPQSAAGGGGGATPAVAVRELLQAQGLELELAAGEPGLHHSITLARVQRPGLALTGYSDYLRYGRVQILGGSEMGYLRRQKPPRRAQLIAKLTAARISCFVVTKGLEPPAELLRQADERHIPVLTTRLESTPFIRRLSGFLEERLALQEQRHGVLVDVFGLGVLILGDSGIGKSECALDLVDRGHRLVADDVVELRRLSETVLGSSPALTRSHMEVRGLGLINIEDLYGVSALRVAKSVDLVVQLERWAPGKEYERLGVRELRQPLLGLEVPLVRVPVAPGRNLALLVEVAARTQLQKERGVDAAARFVERYDEMLEARAAREGEPAARRPARGTARRAR